MDRKQSIGMVMAAGFALAIGTSSTAARAESNPVTCDSIPYIDFDYNSGGRLQIGCRSAGTDYNYFAFVNASGCAGNNVALPILQEWKKTAEASLLSGKKIMVYWTSCTDGMKRITAVSLRGQ